MPKIKNFICGYKYTTQNVIRYGELDELKKIARKSNRQLRKERRVERFAVYPVPGTIHGVGQLVVLR